MKGKINFIILVILAGIFSAASVYSQGKTMDIYDANELLAKTINVASTFDAPKEGAWGNVLTKEEIKSIKSAGFTAVRLPIQWVTRMDSVAPYAIDKSFLKRIDEVVKQALKNKLAIILENCIDEQLMTDPAKYKARFMSLWEQLSAHYASRPQQVMFEIMAEPHGKLSDVWADYFTGALALIRRDNVTRPVIIGPTFFNNPHFFHFLNLPENDRYIIGTFHLYEPIKFTMQGEQWLPFGKPMEWLGTQWTASPAEQKAITDNMDIAFKWATTNKRPVFMGEFGASDHADIDSKAKFLAFYRQQAEQRHFSWGVFSYVGGFSICDKSTGQWRPALLNALIPAL
jgi:endoglucanase